MKKFRQRIAVALAVALTSGIMTVPSFADQVQTKGWVLEEGLWHYYDSEGNMKKNNEKFIHGKFYAFDKEGRMFEDELFVSPKSDDIFHDENGKEIPNRYAYPDGHLAVNSWVKLNEEGHMYTAKDAKEEAALIWYYFKSGNEETQRAGAMARDEEKTINKKVYRFHEDGAMYLQEWYGNQPHSNKDLPFAGETYYYQANGDKAINKWLPLEGSWYHFDEKGLVTEVWNEDEFETASDSNAKAPYPAEESVERTGDKEEVEIELGRTATLKFQAKLASGSNAEKNIFKKSSHDIWGKQTLLGKFRVTEIKEDGLCTVEYTPGSLGSEEVTLLVDGIESDPYIVKTVLPKTEDSTDTAKALDTLLGSLVDNGSDGSNITGDLTETLDTLKNELDKSGDNEELAKEIAKKDNYEKVDNLYIMKNKIDVKTVDLTNVQSVLGENGGISMVGGALNTPENGTVELKVDTAELPADLDSVVQLQSKDKSVALDIKIAINNSEQSKLDLPVKITISLPEGFENGKKISIYHSHESGPIQLLDEVKPENGEFSFATSKFSSFTFVQKNSDAQEPTNPGGSSGSSSSGGGSSSVASNKTGNGQWILDASGWWYKNSTGSYPANTWSYLNSGDVKDWYRFDQNGYVITGWFTDTDGRIYYLNPVSNGYLGAMLTGWQLIDGHWYYFNTESNGYKGMLLVNTVTPDGYHVNESGQRID